MSINELKRELSKVSGIDFFNPKYRAIFKRFSGDKNENDEEGAKDELQENGVKAGDEANLVAESVEHHIEEEESVSNDDSAEEDGELYPNSAQSEPMKFLQKNEPPEIQTEADSAQSQDASNITDELLTTKLELELVRAGIREDRLETAKRLFMPEFKASGGNVDEIRELISQYPEWITKGNGAQGFGMPLGDKADALTNEEKALKRMGINPRE